VFQFELDYLRVEAAEKGRPYEITWAPDSTPHLQLLDPRDEADVLARLAELKRVAPEAVLEEAMLRVIRRLRGVEYRTPPEVALELAEADRAE
jgi:hypothetical protein